MREKEQKILKIIDAMFTYCVFVGGNDIQVRTHNQEDKEYTIEINSDFEQRFFNKYIKKLDGILNQPKDPQIEANYWGMIGSTEFEDDNDIYVVASMVDSASVKIDGNRMQITITKSFTE